jgi:hypothetical protein
LIFNWVASSKNGEEFSQYQVGKNGVDLIEEHIAQGEGDKWCYNVYLNDGKIVTIFNPNQVIRIPIS